MDERSSAIISRNVRTAVYPTSYIYLSSIQTTISDKTICVSRFTVHATRYIDINMLQYAQPDYAAWWIL